MPHPRHAFRPAALGGLLMVALTLGCSSLTGTSMNTADVIGRAVTSDEEFAPEPDEDIDVAPPYWPAPDPFEGIASYGPWDGTAETDRVTPPIVEPTPEPPPVTWVAGPPEINGNDIIARAQEMLGIPYV